VRARLLQLAAARLALPATGLALKDGAFIALDGRRASFGQLVSGQELHVRATPEPAPPAPGPRTAIGQSLPRVDIPAKVSGGRAYVQDLRLPNMVHARVVRPPSQAASLTALDAAAVMRLPGVLKVVR